MKRLTILFFIIILSLTGCSNDNRYENIQKKINKQGYKTKLEREAGIEVDHIKVVNETLEFIFSVNRDTKKISQYSFDFAYSASDSSNPLIYEVENKKMIGLVIGVGGEAYNCAYNLDKNKEDVRILTDGCSDAEIELIDSIKKLHDLALEDLNITSEEFIEWAQWYSDNN